MSSSAIRFLSVFWRSFFITAPSVVLAIFLAVVFAPSLDYSLGTGQWGWTYKDISYSWAQVIDGIWDSLIVFGLILFAAFLTYRWNNARGFLFGLTVNTIVTLFNYNLVDSLLYREGIIAGLAFWDYGMPVVITGIFISLAANTIGVLESRWLFGRPRSANPKPNEIW